MVWFSRMGNMMSLVVNLADIEHDPNEAEKSELSDINYSW